MKETAVYLRLDKLRWFLAAARIVELGIAPGKFEEMVSLQQRLKKTGYTNLTDQETELVADIWERLKKYVHERGPGYEHLVALVEGVT